MEEEKKIEDVIEVSLVTNSDLVKMYQDVESFLKYLDSFLSVRENASIPKSHFDLYIFSISKYTVSICI